MAAAESAADSTSRRRLAFWHRRLTIDPQGRRFSGIDPDSGLDPGALLQSHPDFQAADRQKLGKLDLKRLQRAEQEGVVALTPQDLPERFQEAAGMPPALFCWGDSQALHEPIVAIVGTRGGTAYGQAIAQKFAETLARAGAVIASGGAIGIDAAAHKGALKAGGKTIAVLAHGVDLVRPAVNRGLFAHIRQNGCLVSQFPIGMPSLRHNFPARNHTLAGLCQAVVVVEAPERSGALITARVGAEVGRDVFVTPGPITLDSFRGSHALIRDGAVLVDHPDQVIEALGLEPPAPAATLPEGPEAAILELLKEKPLSSDRIAEELGMDAGETLAKLTVLEMEGLVLRGPAGFTAAL